ncbi:effector-associated constant component EACC1 [Actinoplanes subglobosus]|uniref:Uncharacterized protein n=1 Tax=Actinoplanes subglobosus TaxID=1547892 RepID=A0ABV8J6V6_9ACTN
MSERIDVELVVRNGRYHEDDPRWLDQIAALVSDLRRGTGAVHTRRTPVPHTKGAVDQVILTLGSAGVFSVAVQMINTWLSRDRNRSVEITYTDTQGRVHTVRVSAENASREAFAPLVAAAEKLAQEQS